MVRGEVVSLGSVNVDVQVRAQRWPEPGETLLGHTFLMIGGGKAANISYLARRLDVASRLIARVGDDTLADQALGSLVASGVDLRHTRRVPGHPTGVALIVVRADGEKSIVLAANANDAWRPDDADDAARAVATAPAGSALVVDLEVPQAVVGRAIDAARRRGLVVVLDPSPAERLSCAWYPNLDYVTPNRTEASALTGIAVRSIEDAFRAGDILVVERGVKRALVKLGVEGTVIVGAGTREHVPVAPVRVVDTTGAGDAFAGALAVALVEGQPQYEAVRFAVAAATFAVTRYGSQPSYPTRAEIERLFAEPFATTRR
jgi:ribokinase